MRCCMSQNGTCELNCMYNNRSNIIGLYTWHMLVSSLKSAVRVFRMARKMFASLAQPQHFDNKTMWQYGIRIKYLISLRLFVWQIPKLHITIYHLKIASFELENESDQNRWVSERKSYEEKRPDESQNKMKNWSPNNRMQTSIRHNLKELRSHINANCMTLTSTTQPNPNIPTHITQSFAQPSIHP